MEISGVKVFNQEIERSNKEDEDKFRLELSGWKNLAEYKEIYGDPERWNCSKFIKVLRTKKDGFYIYYEKERENVE